MSTNELVSRRFFDQKTTNLAWEVVRHIILHDKRFLWVT